MNNKEESKWAVIQSGEDNKITTIPLSDWNFWEWDDFKTVKKNGSIAWFEEKEEAIDFIFEHFNREEISESIIQDGKLPRGYHW